MYRDLYRIVTLAYLYMLNEYQFAEENNREKDTWGNF